MAYVAPVLKAPGDPVTATDWNVSANNEIDHESRISAIEVIAQRIEVINDEILITAPFSTLTNSLFAWKARQNFDVTNAVISIKTKGALTGVLEIDLKKSSTYDYSLASSIFTTKPKIDFAVDPDYHESTNAVFGAGASITTGDWLFLDITSMPTNGILGRFHIIAFGEV